MFRKTYAKYREIINYLIVGILTTIVSLFVYYFCVFTFCDPNKAIQLQMANIISWIAAVTFSYYTNRKYVFQSKSSSLIKELLSFYGSRLFTLLIDMLSMFLMVTMIGISDKIAKLIVQVIVTIGNYILSKFFVFRKK